MFALEVIINVSMLRSMLVALGFGKCRRREYAGEAEIASDALTGDFI